VEEKMIRKNRKRWLWLGVACMVALPVAAEAQEYLKGKTSYRPLESDDIARSSGDFSQDYEQSGSGAGVAAKRQRVETRVKNYMDQVTAGGDKHTHNDNENITSETFSALVERAQKGDAAAIGQVGYAYQHGLGTQKSEQQALAWYTRAIEYGETQYYSIVGEMYRDYSAAKARPGFFAGLRSAFSSANSNSSELPDNDQVAREWFEKGVYSKDWQSYLKMGEMYRDGAGGLVKDMEKAKWYYNEGLRLKRIYNNMSLLEIEQRFRAQVELEEGLRTPETPVLGWLKESSNPGIFIGDHYCTLRNMGTPTAQYTAFYEAYCSGLSDKQKRASPTATIVRGLNCNVTAWPDNDTGKDFELRCR
jgi:hypothetical protein